MSKNRNILIGIALIYLLLAACSKKQAEEITPLAPGSSGTAITYTNFVKALFQTKCAFCHAPGTNQNATAAWTYNGYSSITSISAEVKQAVLVNKTMPLSGSLSGTELQSLQAWFDQGTPQ